MRDRHLCPDLAFRPANSERCIKNRLFVKHFNTLKQSNEIRAFSVCKVSSCVFCVFDDIV